MNGKWEGTEKVGEGKSPEGVLRAVKLSKIGIDLTKSIKHQK